MEKFLEFIAPLKIPTEIILGMCTLIALFFNLAPKNLLMNLSLLEFVNTNKFYISLTLLISMSYFIVVVIKNIFKFCQHKYDLYTTRKIQIETLENLKLDSRKIIIELYQNGCTGYLDINKATTGLLDACNIRGRASHLSISGTTFGYFLQPWVVEYLDNRNNYKKFIQEVENNEI